MKNKLLKLLMVLAISTTCNNFSFADYDLEDAMEDHYKNMNRMNMMNMHPGMMGSMGMGMPMGVGVGMHHYHHHPHWSAFKHGLGSVGKIALGAAAGIGAATYPSYPPMY